MLQHEFDGGMNRRGVVVEDLPIALRHNWFRDCEKLWMDGTFQDHYHVYDYIAPKMRERKARLLGGEFQTNLEVVFHLEKMRDEILSHSVPSGTRKKIEERVERATAIVYGGVWERFDLKTGYYEDEKHACYEYIVCAVDALIGALRHEPDVYANEVAERVWKPFVEIVKEQFRRYLVVEPSSSLEKEYRAKLKNGEYLGDVMREEVIDTFIALIFRKYDVRVFPSNVATLFA